LRRHLVHVSHPIIGDSTYGKGRHNRLFAERYAVRRLLLACVRIAFDHPATGQRIDVAADPGAEFALLAREFGWPGATSDAPASDRAPELMPYRPTPCR
jgi:tRNA pseudouridine65 synthase